MKFCTTTDGNSKSCRTKGPYLSINGACCEFKMYCLHDSGCGKVELESSGVALWLYTKHQCCQSLSVCMQLLAYIPTICFPLPARVGRREGIPSDNDAFRPCHSERSHPSISKRVWWRTTPSCLIRNPVFTPTTIFNRWFGLGGKNLVALALASLTAHQGSTNSLISINPKQKDGQDYNNTMSTLCGSHNRTYWSKHMSSQDLKRKLSDCSPDDFHSLQDDESC